MSGVSAFELWLRLVSATEIVGRWDQSIEVIDWLIAQLRRIDHHVSMDFRRCLNLCVVS